MTGKRKVRASEPTPSRPMTAVTPAVRRRHAAPLELARALAAAGAAEQLAGEARVAEERAQAAEADAALAQRLVPAPAREPVAEPEPDRRPLREKARAREGLAEVLLFTVGGEHFGIDLASVEEAIELSAVHHVPEMPSAMEGVITVRETLTSVYSPRLPLGVSHATGACALVFRRRRSRLALVIDDVEDARTLDLTHLREAPSVAAAGVVLGVVRLGDALCSLIDTDALLAACQATSLREST
ncbi:MAG TPA: chemotaxis protein CheW [Gemmatimonadaceae bacterium]|nr:chemotaxis protein CheW [Gemmatimonadaceae bacterium]